MQGVGSLGLGGRGPRTSLRVSDTRFCSLITRKPRPRLRLLPAPLGGAAEPANARGGAGAEEALGGGAGVSQAEVRTGEGQRADPRRREAAAVRAPGSERGGIGIFGSERGEPEPRPESEGREWKPESLREVSWGLNTSSEPLDLWEEGYGALSLRVEEAESEGGLGCSPGS